nr:uncharacterized protein LOC111390093 [Ipomoea trifida]
MSTITFASGKDDHALHQNNLYMTMDYSTYSSCEENDLDYSTYSSCEENDLDYSTYSSCEENDLVGYSDSDWIEIWGKERVLASGYYFMLGKTMCSSSSKKQSIVASSTYEAKCIIVKKCM